MASISCVTSSRKSGSSATTPKAGIVTPTPGLPTASRFFHQARNFSKRPNSRENSRVREWESQQRAQDNNERRDVGFDISSLADALRTHRASAAIDAWPWFILNPNGTKMAQWDVLTSAALIFTAIVTPFEVCEGVVWTCGLVIMPGPTAICARAI